MHGSKLNQEAKNTYSHSYSVKIVEEYFSQNEDITGQKIISVTSIKQVNFFVLKALFEEWQVEIKKFKSPYFDYKNEDVNQALKNLVNTLSKHIQIKKEDFQPLLEKAVSNTLELLYNPTQFYYNEMSHAHASNKSRELKTNSKYIKVYKSLYDDILNKLEQNTDLELIIRQAVSNFPDPMEERQGIEAQFNKTLQLNVLEMNEIEELSMPEPLAELDEKEQKSPILTDDIKEEFEPIGDDSVGDLQQPINEQYKEDIQTLNERFEEKEIAKSVAAVHESNSLSDLKNNININQRYMFVNDLFDGNDKDYELAMDEVENCESFDSSVELLVQNYSKKYEWDMNTDEVKELLKVIFKRFR